MSQESPPEKQPKPASVRRWSANDVVLWVAACLLLVWRYSLPSPKPEETAYPQRPVEIVVPFAAGGGSDVFARMVEAAINDHQLLSQPVFITNISGGSGTIGSRVVKNARPDGHRILCLHEGIITSWQSGIVPFGPEAFEPIAQTGVTPMAVVVRDDAVWQSLPDLMQAAATDPQSLRFGTNIGAPAHFAGLMLERAWPGAEFNYVQSGGGQKRYALLVGGHVEVGVFSLAEYADYRGDEDTPATRRLRALAVLSEARQPGFGELPTAVESGIDVVSGNAQYWWAPLETSPTVVASLADALQQVMQVPEVREKLKLQNVAPVVRRGHELQEHIDTRIEACASVSIAAEHDLPDFVLWTTGVVLLLGGAVTFQSLRASSATNADTLEVHHSSDNAWITAVASFLLLMGYALCLHAEWIGFVPATIIFISLIGGVLVGRRTTAWIRIIALAIGTSILIESVFATLLSVPLP